MRAAIRRSRHQLNTSLTGTFATRSRASAMVARIISVEYPNLPIASTSAISTAVMSRSPSTFGNFRSSTSASAGYESSLVTRRAMRMTRMAPNRPTATTSASSRSHHDPSSAQSHHVALKTP